MALVPVVMTKQLLIVGVDPGKVTGIAIWWSGDPGSPVYRREVPAVDVASDLREVLRTFERPTLIACERFIKATGGRPQTAQPDADRVIGAVRSLADELVVRCVYQSPGPAKRVAPDRLLRQLGWYTRTPDGHANDACRHVLLALATFHVEVFARLTGL